MVEMTVCDTVAVSCLHSRSASLYSGVILITSSTIYTTASSVEMKLKDRLVKILVKTQSTYEWKDKQQDAEFPVSQRQFPNANNF